MAAYHGITFNSYFQRFHSPKLFTIVIVAAESTLSELNRAQFEQDNSRRKGLMVSIISILIETVSVSTFN